MIGDCSQWMGFFLRCRPGTGYEKRRKIQTPDNDWHELCESHVHISRDSGSITRTISPTVSTVY
jgi:hypothetical protein